MRGATYFSGRKDKAYYISIHAPHAGRDVRTNNMLMAFQAISIHAPHAGRDYLPRKAVMLIHQFQSTRPMRGATQDVKINLDLVPISIHAPHAGRDSIHIQSCTRP